MARDIGGENSSVPARHHNLSLTMASAFGLKPWDTEKLGHKRTGTPAGILWQFFPERALHLTVEIKHD